MKDFHRYSVEFNNKVRACEQVLMMLDRFNFKEWAYWGHLTKNLWTMWIKYALDWLLAKNMSWLSISQGNMYMASLQNNNKSLLVAKMVMVEKCSQKDTTFESWREDNQSAFGCLYAYPSFIWKNNFWYGSCISNADWRAESQLKGWQMKQRNLSSCSFARNITGEVDLYKLWGLDIYSKPEEYRQVSSSDSSSLFYLKASSSGTSSLQQSSIAS